MKSQSKKGQSQKAQKNQLRGKALLSSPVSAALHSELLSKSSSSWSLCTQPLMHPVLPLQHNWGVLLLPTTCPPPTPVQSIVSLWTAQRPPRTVLPL